MSVESFLHQPFDFDKLFFDICSVVPVYIRDDSWGEPVHFEGAHVDESGNGPHESDGEAVTGHFLLLNGAAVDFFLRWIYLFVFVVEIANYVIDFAFLRLGDLLATKFTLGRREMN